MICLTTDCTPTLVCQIVEIVAASRLLSFQAAASAITAWLMAAGVLLAKRPKGSFANQWSDGKEGEFGAMIEHPQHRASAEAIWKLSCVDVHKHISEDCKKGAKSAFGTTPIILIRPLFCGLSRRSCSRYFDGSYPKTRNWISGSASRQHRIVAISNGVSF